MEGVDPTTYPGGRAGQQAMEGVAPSAYPGGRARQQAMEGVAPPAAATYRAGPASAPTPDEREGTEKGEEG